MPVVARLIEIRIKSLRRGLEDLLPRDESWEWPAVRDAVASARSRCR